MEYQGNQRASDWSGWPVGQKHLCVERKMDGYRLSILVHSNGAMQFFCRDPDPVTWAPNLKHIEEQVKALKLRKVMLDGEVMADDWSETGIIRSGCSGKKYTPPDKSILQRIKKTVNYHVFDLVDFTKLKTMKIEGKRGEICVDPTPYWERKERVIELIESFSFKSLQAVNHYKVGDEVELDVINNEYIEEGYEGSVAKVYDSPYVFDKTKFWLKMKPVKTTDLQVVEVVEGNGKYKGTLGTLLCVDSRGIQIGVGIGFTDAVRDSLWKKRSRLPGRILEVKSQDSDIATSRSPVFVRWRPDRQSL